MKHKPTTYTAAGCALLFAAATALHGQSGQPQAALAAHYVTNCIKVEPGKAREYQQFIRDVSVRLAQSRANAGRFAAWSTIRAISPAGASARCDYIVTTFYSGTPAAPGSADSLGADLKAAGIAITADQFLEKRNSLSRLVATEVWQSQERVGRVEKGHYLKINHMKAPSPAAYAKFEHEVWRPMAEMMVQEGSLSGWSAAARVLPAGTGMPYNFVTVDAYPSWEAAFKPLGIRNIFTKVHADKDVEQTMTSANQLREHVAQELFVAEHVIRKQ